MRREVISESMVPPQGFALVAARGRSNGVETVTPWYPCTYASAHKALKCVDQMFPDGKPYKVDYMHLERTS